MVVNNLFWKSFWKNCKFNLLYGNWTGFLGAIVNVNQHNIFLRFTFICFLQPKILNCYQHCTDQVRDAKVCQENVIHVHLLPLPDARDDDEVHDDAEDGQAHVQDDHQAAPLMRCHVLDIVTGQVRDAVAAKVDLQLEKVSHFEDQKKLILKFKKNFRSMMELYVLWCLCSDCHSGVYTPTTDTTTWLY